MDLQSVAIDPPTRLVSTSRASTAPSWALESLLPERPSV